MVLLYFYLLGLMVIERVNYTGTGILAGRVGSRTRIPVRSLPARLPLGLLGKGIVGPWLWLDVGLWESPSQCNLG